MIAQTLTIQHVCHPVTSLPPNGKSARRATIKKYPPSRCGAGFKPTFAAHVAPESIAMGLVAGGGPLAFLVTGVVGIHVWRVGDQAQQVG